MDGLRDFSQSHLINAFHDLKFNKYNGRGVHGACPSDMLHTFQLGIFKYLRDVFFEFIGALRVGAQYYKPFVPFIKCDTKEADEIYGKFQMRSGNVKQLCRYCKVPTCESNDHLHKC